MELLCSVRDAYVNRLQLQITRWVNKTTQKENLETEQTSTVIREVKNRFLIVIFRPDIDAYDSVQLHRTN